MVGRVAISNPWALARIRAEMVGDAPPPEPTLGERIRTALEHVRMMIACEADAASYEEALSLPAKELADAELRACRALRGQVPLYIKGEHGASQVRDRLTRCSSLAEFEDVLMAFGQGVEALRR
jgi:tRNA-dihydrouridine synthase